jgi:hypothetical protein
MHFSSLSLYHDHTNRTLLSHPFRAILICVTLYVIPGSADLKSSRWLPPLIFPGLFKPWHFQKAGLINCSRVSVN